MHPGSPISRCWHSIPLIARLVGALLLTVALAVTVRTVLLAQEARAFAVARLAEELSVVQAIVPAELIEELQRGNHETAAQFLQRQVDVRPDLVELSWRAADGRSITAQDRSPSAEHAPAWFVARMGIPISPVILPLQAEGVAPGSLTIRFDPAHALLPAWLQVFNQLKAVAAVLFSIALLSWLVLRSTLRGLRELKAAAQAFESGDFAVRAPLYGAPELRATTTAFNTMADRVAQLVRTVQTEKERAEVTLASIGDAVITTDAEGCVSFLNAVAVRLTGWTQEEGAGKPLAEIFHIVNEATRMRVENPVEQVLRFGKTVNLANHTVLISRSGTEYCIEDSAAPIRLPDGALLGCVLVFHDVTDNKKLLNAVQWQAGHDALTGLPNRALLTDRFQRALASARRQNKLLGVCLLDLDGFKPVNDRYGHEVGDRLLVEVARRMQAKLRGEDSVARLGGDEFVLLLGDAQNVEEIYAAAQRIIDAIAQPCCEEIGAITVSASIGLTVYPFDDADSDTLLRHADQAMYQAKQLGRSRFHLFNVSEDRETQAAHRSLLRLREALRADELVLHYQPKVNLRNGSVIGMEALLRWQHPQDGLIPPLDFLPLAEQSDLIVDIGEWVTERALQQMEQWQAAGLVWSVSVNIAAHHFQREDFTPRLAQILARHPALSPALLEIEILESVALDDLHGASDKIAACRRLGVGFALDDFGTGYSSLSYLKHLPAETLKIDQSFVRDMLDDEQDITIVEAVIGLARLFNRSVIAEGVETAEHGVLLMRLGCDEAQGYGIARPMPAAQVADWVRQYQPDPSWVLWADARWEISNLPLLVAQHDHLQWVRRVTLAVENAPLALSTGELKNHHQCRFGRWYYGHGRATYGHLPEFVAIEPVHVQVHETGTEIIRLRDAGEIERARELCGKLLGLKDQILVLTHALQVAVLATIRQD
ncbi:EAL domain-containing protein [Ferrigenium sp. UT5]|uniref:EAL domain-containing protein n=1 Tax=Ferrigenium sp. UT5 TaxID=3242105 RepID=UPI0035532D7A